MTASFWFFLLLPSAVCSFATQLPTRVYTTSDGLPSNYILRIYHDSKGYVWFCTSEGLSRYDGYTFINYGLADGLPDRRITDIVEMDDDIYWVGTRNGLCRFDPAKKPGQKFSVLTPAVEGREGRTVLRLMRSRAGQIWCGTGNGLYRVDGTRLQRVNLQLPQEQRLDTAISGISEDAHGGLWFITGTALYHYKPSEAARRYSAADGLPRGLLQTIAMERAGTLWVGGESGLSRFVPDPNGGLSLRGRVNASIQRQVTEYVTAVDISSDGRVWAGTAMGGLFELTANSPTHVTRHTVPGLPGYYIEQIKEDRDSNRWLATGGGAAQIIRNGFLRYSEADGLGSTRILGKCGTQSGAFGLISVHNRELVLNVFDPATNRFKAIKPRLPALDTRPTWTPRQIALQSQSGEWWIGTTHGLARFPQVSTPEQLSRMAPRIYTTRDGLPDDEINSVFEDKRGDIWIATSADKGYGLAKWNRASNKFRVFGTSDGLPLIDYNAAWAFAEDHAGGIWVAFGTSLVARYSHGRFRVFTERDGWLPARHFHIDRARRLWFTAHHGVGRVDSPDAINPQLKMYFKADGLSSETTWGITEDDRGRIYVGTTGGLDRLDPETGRIRHYRTAEGLPEGDLPSVMAFHHGAVWYGTVRGLGRLIPEPPQHRQPPQIVITAVHAGAAGHPISDLGEREIRDIQLPIEQAHLRIDFSGLSDIPGEPLTYQMRLENYDQSWSKPGPQRSVTYAGLGAGRYRFLVRAINEDGVASDRNGVVEFTIVPALLDRWWMRLLLGLLVSITAYGAYRYRMARLLDLQRIRMRIATDLHDDVGASLSQIAILSEVARRNAEVPTQRWTSVLSDVAEISRQLVDDMSDIVWAIDPQRDHIGDIVQRMRHFALGVCGARGIRFQLQTPEGTDHLIARSDVRRQVSLVFKECINNSLRHSSCTEVCASLAIERGLLILKISDNGIGFCLSQVPRGRGLRSMSERARELGGDLIIDSNPGAGVTVTLQVPLRLPVRRRILHKWVGARTPPAV
jgi:ligand-binding sensor domain-containing protein/signal transduction histidine kinase